MRGQPKENLRVLVSKVLRFRLTAARHVDPATLG